MTANLWDVVRYFKRYRTKAIWSIAGSSAFEIIDLTVPYTVGQILNVLSGRSLDREINGLVVGAVGLFGQPVTQTTSLIALSALIFVVRNENLLSCAIRLLMKQHDLGLKIKCTGYLFFIPYSHPCADTGLVCQ
jgi:hypothetical protein